MQIHESDSPDDWRLKVDPAPLRCIRQALEYLKQTLTPRRTVPAARTCSSRYASRLWCTRYLVVLAAFSCSLSHQRLPGGSSPRPASPAPRLCVRGCRSVRRRAPDREGRPSCLSGCSQTADALPLERGSAFCPVDDVAGAPHHRCGVEAHHLADHQPVKQHAHCRQVLLHAGSGVRRPSCSI